MFKQDELCTLGIDEFIKLKSLNKPPAKAMQMTLKVFTDTNDFMVKKYVVNRVLNCHGFEASHLTAMQTLLKYVGDEPEGVKEVVSRANLPSNEMIQMITVTEE